MIRWLLAALHLLALGTGLGAIWARRLALRGALDPAGLRRVFHADTWWGVSALIWISTGLLRAFAGFEKGTQYYLQSHLFLTKMGLLIGILLLEIAPMAALIRWRVEAGRGNLPETRRAGTFARVSAIQTILLLLMLIAATGMARGYGGF